MLKHFFVCHSKLTHKLPKKTFFTRLAAVAFRKLREKFFRLHRHPDSYFARKQFDAWSNSSRQFSAWRTGGGWRRMFRSAFTKFAPQAARHSANFAILCLKQFPADTSCYRSHETRGAWVEISITRLEFRLLQKGSAWLIQLFTCQWNHFISSPSRLSAHNGN